MKRTDLQEIITFLHKTRKTKELIRFSNNPFVKKKDTVASHSWRAVLIALLLKDAFNEYKLDTEKIIEMLIIHDLVEIENKQVKALGFRNRKAKQINEYKVLEHLFKEYKGGWTKKIHRILKEFLEQKTLESKVAKMIDNYESNMHAIEEIEPIRNKEHERRTIDYIKRRENILPLLDEFIKLQLKEINEIS